MSKLHIDAYMPEEYVTKHTKDKWRRADRKWKAQCKYREREKLARDENRYSPYYIVTWYYRKKELLPKHREYIAYRGTPDYIYQEFDKTYINQRGEEITIRIKGMFANKLKRKLVFSNQYTYQKEAIPKYRQYVHRGSITKRHGKQMKPWDYYRHKSTNKKVRSLIDMHNTGISYKKI